MRPTSTYTTPEAVIEQLDKANPSAPPPAAASAEYANFRALVTRYCWQASAYITTMTGRSFVPYRAVYVLRHADLFNHRAYRLGRLALPDDALSLTAMTWNGTLTPGTDYYTDPLPAEFLYINPAASLTLSSTWGAVTQLDGWWGWHSTYDTAWRITEPAVTLTSSATTLTVPNAGRYETLQYLKIDSEMMQVTARNTTTNVLTIERGVNGTTDAAHSAAPLSVFDVAPDVALAATRLVAHLYQKRNDVGNLAFPDGSVLIERMPTNVKETLVRHTRRVWGSV